MRKATFALGLALFALLASFSWAVPGQEPATYQGKRAEWWAEKTTHWKRAAVKRGHSLRRIRTGLRERVQLSGSGVAQGFKCIHRFEGSWSDGGAPFWGGLQMDLQFQRSYGGAFLASLGTADRWPPFVQLAVAMEAYYSGRGFTPWPNTRRRCGL